MLEQLGNTEWRIGIGTCLRGYVEVALGRNCWLRPKAILRKLLGNVVLRLALV